MPSKNEAPLKTVTCQHCRYERPAEEAHCHICGYPWTFVKNVKKTVKKRTRG